MIGNHEVQHNLDQLILAKDFDDLINGDSHMDALFSVTRQFRSMKPKKNEGGPGTFITEVLHPSDPRNDSSEASTAKRKEIESLVKRETWKVVIREEVPKGSNIINGRFVMAIKDTETNKPYFKARFVAQGHRDKEKSVLVHNSKTVRQSSIRILLALAALFGFRIWSLDVNNAYLQSASQLLRDIYLKPGKEFELPSGHLLKLLRPLYGLADSGNYWNETFANHIKNDLKMKPTALDISFFFKKANGKLKGLAGTYVDDTLFAGDTEFLDHTEETSRRFESKDRELDSTRFSGVYIENKGNGFAIHQSNYVDRLEELGSNATFEQFRSARAQLTWLIHTRPDICARANILAQVTKDSMDKKHVKEFNKVVQHLKSTPRQGLVM